MSTFFRALERAEQERAMRHPAAPAPVTESAPIAPPPTPPAPPATAPEPPPVRTPRSVFRAPTPPRETAPRPIAAPTRSHDYELEEHLVSLTAPSSFEADQYRALRHMVEQLRRSSELSVIAVSSPDGADGKTTTTINLAGALAQDPDARVLLVDADLRGGNLAVRLGIDEHTPGFVDAILNPSLTLEAVTQVLPYLNLSVLQAGRRPTSPYEVLKSPRVGELLAEARTKYEYVIVDTPPLVSVPDARIIAKSVDGFLIVVAANFLVARTAPLHLTMRAIFGS